MVQLYSTKPKWNLDEDAALFEKKMYMDEGVYTRKLVSNLRSPEARLYFDLGLRRLFGYHHQEAIKYFDRCKVHAPDCALVPALMALCHCPNYNFTGDAYYNSTSSNYRDENENGVGPSAVDHAIRTNLFPCQESAYYYSKNSQEIVVRLNGAKSSTSRKTKKKNKIKKMKHLSTDASTKISQDECLIIDAIQELTKVPGISADRSEETVGRPYANALRKAYKRFGRDPDIAYLYAESLLVLNAWELYEFTSQRTISPDVDEARAVLESALRDYPEHAGLCHLYIHLCEMSPDPGAALEACMPLRTKYPTLGHLIHMPTHIDALIGDYDSCVRYNLDAINTDMNQFRQNPDSAGVTSFYFGYIMHNFHMLVYGAILGGMERVGMENATRLNGVLNEDLFEKHPELTPYAESYSALEVHILVRFGKWKAILEIPLPFDQELMLFRAASIHFAKGLAHAALGDVENAKKEAAIFEKLASHPSAHERLLHNNIISVIFHVDIPMLRGEIAYREKKYDKAFELLRKAISLQDSLKYDEPWGKMQPIRHALGGLLLEQGRHEESESVFREDLKRHPKNPWALRGLIDCLKKQLSTSTSCKTHSCCESNTSGNRILVRNEIEELQDALQIQRESEWADFDISVSCACCKS